MKNIYSILAVIQVFITSAAFSQDQPVYQTHKLADGIYELAADGGGYPVKVIASVGEDGLLIVDSGEKENGDALVEALKAFGKGLPKIIINTHSHIEHLGGNIAIGSGPVIIGHENLHDRYMNGLYIFNGIPESALPDITFRDSLTVRFNGEEIRLIAFPGAHDNSDIIVWFTKSKIVCTAALCNGHHFPSVDAETGNILKYPETVAKVISILPEDVLLVPGHADDCTMEEFREFYDMLVQTSALIRSGLSTGKSFVDLQEEDLLSAWNGWELYVDRDAWIQYWAKAIQYPREPSQKKKVYAPVYYAVQEKGADSAMALYKLLTTKQQDQYQFDERTSMWIGRRLAYTGDNEGAVKFLDFCIKTYPDTDAAAISQYTLGNICWNNGKKEEAKEHYKQYLKKFPRDKTANLRVMSDE